MSTLDKYTIIESPHYPRETAERRQWLKARDWTQVSFAPESWSNPLFNGTFSLSNACRAESGFAPEPQ